MTWRYSKAGKEMGCPSSEYGLYLEGPLTVDDWKNVLANIVEEMAEQVKREAREEVGRGG